MSGGPSKPGFTNLLAFAALLLLCLAVYRGAIEGPFLSDDHIYIVANPYVQAFGAGAAREIFDPTSQASFHAGGNYAPVYLLGHAVAWQVFGDAVRGHHLLNVALHALNALLLALLLQSAGASRTASLLAATLFAVHPANVEAVAWISQLKSTLGLAFALAALLAYRRHPLASAAWFGLALLSKASAGFALPMAAALAWAWRTHGRATRQHALGLALWAAIFVAFAVPQYLAFAGLGPAYADPYADFPTQLRSVAAIGARYLALAATGYGASAFHEPDPVASWLDPWWLAGVALGLAFTGRIVVTLRRGRDEAAYWIGAAAAFAPISQLSPFYFGMADRYLYFVLPGLLGGALLLGDQTLARLSTGGWRGWTERLALAAAALLFVSFASQARGRAGLWTDEINLLADAASQYPQGGVGLYVASVNALASGDRDASLRFLRASADRGLHFMRSFQSDPRLAPLRRDPRFHELLYELAGRQIAYTRERGLTTQRRMQGVAAAHLYRGEYEEAIAILQESIRRGGPLHEALLSDLQIAREQRSAARSKSSEKDSGEGTVLPPGLWKRARVRATDANLSPEERERIAQLESLGYASGSEAPSGAAGVARFEPERAQIGLNFLTSGHAPEAVLMDMEGKVLQRWHAAFETIFPDSDRKPPPHWRRARPLPNGDVVVVFEGQGIARLDADSRVVWASDVRAHHDFELLPDGRVIVLTRDVNQVEGILGGRAFLEDFVSILDADGREVQRVSVLEALMDSLYRDWFDPGRSVYGDVLHTNSIRLLDGTNASELPAFAAGHLLLSMAVPSLIAVLDLDAARIAWAHRGDFRHQHDPRLLDNGHVLFFDNAGDGGASRVLEIDPATLEQRWSYRGTAAEPFFTQTCGTAQRLANGNTLITESENGRAFEVTPGGEIVWEFFSPYRAGDDAEYVATLFEVLRLPASFPVDWSRASP